MDTTTFTPSQALAALIAVVATLFIIFTAVHLYRSHTAPHNRPHRKAPTAPQRAAINPPQPTTTQQLQQQNKQLNNIFWLVLLSMFRKK